jgi:oligoribonuclease (3'-5' exoribonuclease)
MTLLFLDTETTGLSSAQDQVIEVAGFVTDDDGANRRAEFSQLIGVTRHGMERINDNHYVSSMHRRSGLLDELEVISLDEHERRLEQLRQLLRRISQEHGRRQLMLSGFSVHFDARMLLASWRGSDWSTETGGGYRMMDISSVAKAVLEATGQDVRPATDVAHRALSDCDAALSTYRAALDLIAGR